MGVLMLLLPFYTNYEWLTFYAVGTGIAGCKYGFNAKAG